MKGQKGFAEVLVIIVVVLVTIVAGFVFYQNKVETSLSPTTQPSSTTPESISTPEEDTLYLGTYNNEDVIFYTNKVIHEAYRDVFLPSTLSGVYGVLVMAGGESRVPFDFKELVNPRKILSSRPLFSDGVNNFKLNNSKSVAYVSLNYSDRDDGYYPLTNKIFQINLDNLLSKEIWSNQVGSEKYAGGGGVADVKIVAEDKYISFSIGGCFGCGGGGRPGTVILNLNTKEEKYYKAIDNVQFDLTNDMFSYQKLAPFKAACGEVSPGCNDTVYKPTGRVYTDIIP